ncbi:MAG TPA: sulfatase [Thermoanaerobaculia bacterium]
MITRRDAVRVLLASAGGILTRRRATAQTTRPIPRDAPNILLIMTDDQRYDALSIAGNKVLRTPNIDRIGAEGIRFTEFFVTNSLCAPSRASFYTGLYSHVHGVLTNGSGEVNRNQGGLRPDQITFMHLLQQAGYETALVGKWHLRSDPAGFDQWIILPGGGGPYLDPPMTASGGMKIKFRGYADDIVGDQTLFFLQNRSKERPFCLLMNFKAPHRNWIPAARHAHAFEEVEIPIPRTFEDKFEGRPEALRKTDMAIADMPDFKDRGVPETLPRDERKRRNLQELVRNYYRTLLSVDENVGAVLDFLDKNDLAKNTLVIFTSDNGFFLGEHGLFDKRLMYEPSIRVPLLMRQPGKIAAGSVNNSEMVLNIDIAPTLLEAAGIPIAPAMQGRSFVPMLEGKSIPWRDAFLYEYYEFPDADHCVRKNRGVRTARWKLIHFWEQPQEWELYDLRDDPDEIRNLAGRRDHAAIMTELRSRLDALRHQTGDADPPGPPPVALQCHGR